ncbi:MAG: hypothetical protein LUF87_07370 [Alistipes sp.]|nr:hypothetical protein [Alistipes sp.]
MIEIQAKKHDKFSLEFKAGYIAGSQQSTDRFSLNMWIFVPNSLDINAETYPKKQFYRDIKSKVRLITPVFPLERIASPDSVPITNLGNSLRTFATDPSRTNAADYEYEVKMFMAIYQSSLRDTTQELIYGRLNPGFEAQAREYLNNIGNVTGSYRALRTLLDAPGVKPERYNYFLFGDEFMSNITEEYLLLLMKNLLRNEERFKGLIKEITAAVKKEREYSREAGYPVVQAHSPDRNRSLLFRQGVLRKYIESDLSLKENKKRDGVAMEQFYLSLAAGVSMIFATAVAFSFQQKYGNFTMPLFVALVVSYMLKDRIKETMRYYFAHRLKAKYFDNKTSISIKEDRPFGWIREGVDFISDGQAPPEVMELRNRSPLLQAENRINDEKIILYRKMVQLDPQKLHEENRYRIEGINDIMTLYLSTFIRKSHTAEVPIYTLDENDKFKTIVGEKVYYLNIILQLKHGEQEDYRRYRVIFTRNGIRTILPL